jgi:hypothetical protein
MVDWAFITLSSNLVVQVYSTTQIIQSTTLQEGNKTGDGCGHVTHENCGHAGAIFLCASDCTISVTPFFDFI